MFVIVSQTEFSILFEDVGEWGEVFLIIVVIIKVCMTFPMFYL